MTFLFEDFFCPCLAQKTDLADGTISSLASAVEGMEEDRRDNLPGRGCISPDPAAGVNRLGTAN